MIPALAFLAIASATPCGASDPCRTVDAYLRALKAMDEDRLENYVDPVFRSRRADGTEAVRSDARRGRRDASLY